MSAFGRRSGLGGGTGGRPAFGVARPMQGGAPARPSDPLPPGGEPLRWDLPGGSAQVVRWLVAPGQPYAAGTPLENITAPVRYQLQVVDEDGLKLEHAIEGFIRIKADQKPQITTDVVTRFVLPAAEPEVEFRVSDDHGIARIAAYVQAIDGEGNQLLTATGENTPPPPADPTQLKPLALMVRQLEQPLLKASLPLRDVYKLKLSAIRVQLPPPVADSETPPPMRTVRPRALVKGDQLKVTFEVTDYRGTSAGQSTVAEPIVLQVTDESGVLAAISESDERSAKQLDVIIKRQLGIGENK